MRQASSSKGKRVRGYRIHIFRGSDYHPPSYTTPTMWREGPPVAEWQQVLNDPTIRHAWMIQSGRKMREFQFRRGA